MSIRKQITVRVAITIALAGAMLFGLLTINTTGAQAKNPLDGNVMWIWYVDKSGGSADAIARKAKKHNVRTVLIKSSDGTRVWSQFTKKLVSDLKAKGLNVCGWQYTYGANPAAEARAGATAKDRGADCFIINAEVEYEGKYRAADRYMRVLRREVGDKFPLGLSSFPYVHYHPSFPYSVFLGPDRAKWNLPQAYWKAIGTSVGKVYRETYRWNRPYNAKIYPTGQTWMKPSKKQIRKFRTVGQQHGAKGLSWWSWQETTSNRWKWIGKKIKKSKKKAKAYWPKLSVGSRGDVVVLAQELLRRGAPSNKTLKEKDVDGIFGNQTAKAVKAFQNAHGLPNTGVIDKATWKALRKYKPVRTRWYKPKNNNNGDRESAVLTPDSGSGANAPDSARIPPRGYEITPGLRRG